MFKVGTKIYLCFFELNLNLYNYTNIHKLHAYIDISYIALLHRDRKIDGIRPYRENKQTKTTAKWLYHVNIHDIIVQVCFDIFFKNLANGATLPDVHW